MSPWGQQCCDFPKISIACPLKCEFEVLDNMNSTAHSRYENDEVIPPAIMRCRTLRIPERQQNIIKLEKQRHPPWWIVFRNYSNRFWQVNSKNFLTSRRQIHYSPFAPSIISSIVYRRHQFLAKIDPTPKQVRSTT